MRDTLVELIRAQPFQPFLVCLSNGREFEVRHPEMAALSKSNLVINQTDTDRWEVCALRHIANIKTEGLAAG